MAKINNIFYCSSDSICRECPFKRYFEGIGCLAASIRECILEPLNIIFYEDQKKVYFDIGEKHEEES